MPPRYLRKGSTKLKPCSEFKVEACDIAPADQCCGALPCTLCLELEVYGEATTYGTATFGGSSWTGTVGGLAFVSYWEREILPDIIPGTELSANSIGMSWAAIVEATYTMGSPVDEPGRNANETQHVESVEAFNIGLSQVSQEQYYAVMGVNPSYFEIGNNPVEMVSWDDANLFCVRLSALPAEVAMGRTYRLPSEAEWEYACRSGATGAYFFGADPADLPTHGWFTNNSAGQTQTRATKVPNSAGLFDTHGNVWEWTAEGGEANNIVRGGAWDSTAAECRSASRRVVDPTTRSNNIGFRVVMMQGPPLPIPQIGECEYIVTLDGEEVYRATCYEGASCRDPGGSVGVTIGYDEGTLTWTKHEPRPLALTTDPYGGCNEFFCGTCRCSCRTLCVDVFEALFSYGTQYAVDTYSGTLTDTAYSDCDPPVWEGTIGNFEIRLALGRDDYGNCIVTATVDGEESTAIVTGCEDLSGTIELYDGSYFNFRCNDCNNCATVIGDCICGRPMGQTLTLLWSSGNGTHGDAPREFPLSYGMTSAEGIVCAPYPTGGPFPAYTGSNSGNYPIPQGGTRGDTLYIMMVCCIGCPLCVYYRYATAIAVGDLTWYLTYINVIGMDCNCPAILTVDSFSAPLDYQINDVTIFEEASNC